MGISVHTKAGRFFFFGMRSVREGPLEPDGELMKAILAWSPGKPWVSPHGSPARRIRASLESLESPVLSTRDRLFVPGISVDYTHLRHHGVSPQGPQPPDALSPSLGREWDEQEVMSSAQHIKAHRALPESPVLSNLESLGATGNSTDYTHLMQQCFSPSGAIGPLGSPPSPFYRAWATFAPVSPGSLPTFDGTQLVLTDPHNFSNEELEDMLADLLAGHIGRPTTPPGTRLPLPGAKDKSNSCTRPKGKKAFKEYEQMRAAVACTVRLCAPKCHLLNLLVRFFGMDAQREAQLAGKLAGGALRFSKAPGYDYYLVDYLAGCGTSLANRTPNDYLAIVEKNLLPCVREAFDKVFEREFVFPPMGECECITVNGHLQFIRTGQVFDIEKSLNSALTAAFKTHFDKHNKEHSTSDNPLHLLV